MISNVTNDALLEKRRRAMRAELLSHGQGAFGDKELLELLLYHGTRGDARALAARLYEELGSLDAILGSDRESLLCIEGVDEKCAALLTSVGTATELRGVRLGLMDRTPFTTYTVAGEYFADYFRDYNDYGVAVMLLDNSLRMLDALTVYNNTDLCYARVKPSRVIAPALRLKASAVITAHFHPNGPLFPSDGDRATNGAVTDALASLGVTHLEHFVVCGERYIGIMHHLKERFSACSEIYAFLQSKEEAIADGAEVDLI